MDTVNLKGFPVQLLGEFPEEGARIDDLYYVQSNLNETSLHDVEEPIKVVITIPSIDTGVCQTETRKFNEQLGSLKGVKVLIVSKDLPFAGKRFCGAEGIEGVETVSDFRYGDFGEELGIQMVSGTLKGLLARSVLVINDKNKVTYSELVPDVLMEPNYEEAVKAVKALMK